MNYVKLIYRIIKVIFKCDLMDKIRFSKEKVSCDCLILFV